MLKASHNGHQQRVDTATDDSLMDFTGVTENGLPVRFEKEVVDLMQRDPVFRALVTFYIQKNGEQVLNHLLPGVKSVQSRSKRRLLKYKPEELASKYLETLDKSQKNLLTQKELEEATGIEQSIWSRMMKRTDFWRSITQMIQNDFELLVNEFEKRKNRRIHALHITKKKERILILDIGDKIKHNGKEVSDNETNGDMLTSMTADDDESNNPEVAADRALLKNISREKLIQAIQKKQPGISRDNFHSTTRETIENIYMMVVNE